MQNLISRVLTIPVELGAYCRYDDMGIETYDDNGYPWWYPLITMNSETVLAIASELEVSEAEVYDSALAHERGHALIGAKGEEQSEELAWEYARLFGTINPKVEAYCLCTYQD